MVSIENTDKLYQYIEELLKKGVYATVTLKIYDGLINHVDVKRSLNLKIFNGEQDEN